MRATQVAYIEAMRDMAGACRTIADDADSKAAAAQLAALTAHSAFRDFRYDGEHFPLDEANAAIDRMFSGGIAAIAGGDSAAEHHAFGLAVVQDLAVWGIALSPLQARLFTEGGDDHAPWHLRFRIAFGEELIRDPAARSIFTQERLGEIRAQGIVLIDALASLQATMEQGFAAMEQGFAGMGTEMSAVRQMVEAISPQRHEEIAKAGVHLEALVKLAQRIAAYVGDPETALRELDAHVTELLALRAEAARGTNLDADMGAVLRRIDEKATAGEFEAADQEASRAFDWWEAQERERRERALAEGLRYIEANIGTKRFLRDVQGVAYWIVRKTALAAGTAFSGYALLAAEVKSLIDSGRDRGINLDLEVAAALAAIMVANAVVPEERAASQIWLGNALTILGERQQGKAALDNAVAAYRAALKIYTHDAFPHEWATAQNNLGVALQRLGERQQGTAALDDAIAAYHAAQKVCTREAMPRDWAMTQNNLGLALKTLGERQQGTVVLDHAVAAYRAALEVRTRDALPLDWAATQDNLGSALQRLGERQEGTAVLDDAVTAYRTALEVRTRDALPLDWAITQNNLGTALKSLGERQKGTETLDEAVAVYHAALEVRTREALPLDWAMTQNNLGLALKAIGERKEGTVELGEAVVAYRAALEVSTREVLPLNWAATTLNMQLARAMLHERGGGACNLGQLRSEAEAAWTLLVDSGDVSGVAWGRYVIKEIDRIAEL